MFNQKVAKEVKSNTIIVNRIRAVLKMKIYLKTFWKRVMNTL